ncbi:MAG: CotH kinase family protein [Methanocorpusculum sp.]|nr:CotH kinase family protein [Methanocorpusculum sp.]
MRKENVNTIIILTLASAAVIFTVVFMFSPSVLGISDKDTLYELKYFDKGTVNTVEITVSEGDWADILENPTDEEYHMADVTVNGDYYGSAGIRTKGMTSLSMVASSDSERYSFKIKADEYVSGQSFAGLNKFVLNNNYQDATYMKEYLSYDMMASLGVPTPLYSYAAVYINGEYYGLYLMVEAVEEDFAYRNFGASYGELYKPDSMGDMGGGGDKPEGDFGKDKNMSDMQRPEGNFAGFENMDMTNIQMPEGDFQRMNGNMSEFNPENIRAGQMNFGGFGSGGGADLVYTDDNVSSYSTIFDNAVFDGVTEYDKEKVIMALENLKDGTDLKTYVDVDEVLKYFAANTVVVNLDHYAGTMKHNYYLYEENGQLSIIPWDYNLAFGGFQSGDASSVINFPIDTPVSEGISLDERPLIGSLLEVDEYKERYHEYLSLLTSEYLGSSLAVKVEKINSLISDYVELDPTAFFTFDEYKSALEALKEFGVLRGESIAGQLSGKIPSTWDLQNADSSALVNTAGYSLSALGSMGGGGDFTDKNFPSKENKNF